MANPDALWFTSELMLRTKGSCDFWTCSVDSAERLAIQVLTTTAPAQCAVGSAQARNQPVHRQRPGNKLHGDRFVSRLSSFECCHSTLRCGAAPTHRNGAHSNAQRLLPTAGAPFAVQLSRGEVWPPYYDDSSPLCAMQFGVAAERPELESPATTYTVNARRQQHAQGPAPSNIRWGR